MKRPKAFAVGRVRVRVHSGPREDGKWRWRADRPAGMKEGRDVREAVWSGWATRDEAEAAVLEVLTQRGDAYRTAEDVRTVYDLLDVYVADVGPHDKSAQTTRARKGGADRLSESPIASVLLTRLDRAALDRHIRGWTGARSTLRSDLITLRAAWTWARERDLVPDRELPRVTVTVRPDDAVTSRYTPTAEEVARVLHHLRAARTRPKGWAWRAVYLLWSTGCRPGEVATLSWDQVGLEAKRIEVVGKTGRRAVPLHPDTATEVARWPRLNEWVTGSRPANILGHLHRHVERACAKAECERWSLYGLRRAAVMRLYRAGQDPSVAASVLGHSPQTAMRHYRQISDEDLAAAVVKAELGKLPEVVVAGDNVLPFNKRR